MAERKGVPGCLWHPKKARVAGAQPARRQRITGEVKEVGGESILLYFHPVYIISVVSFFSWEDTDFLFVADTKHPSQII